LLRRRHAGTPQAEAPEDMTRDSGASEGWNSIITNSDRVIAWKYRRLWL